MILDPPIFGPDGTAAAANRQVHIKRALASLLAILEDGVGVPEMLAFCRTNSALFGKEAAERGLAVTFRKVRPSAFARSLLALQAADAEDAGRLSAARDARNRMRELELLEQIDSWDVAIARVTAIGGGDPLPPGQGAPGNELDGCRNYRKIAEEQLESLKASARPAAGAFPGTPAPGQTLKLGPHPAAPVRPAKSSANVRLGHAARLYAYLLDLPGSGLTVGKPRCVAASPFGGVVERIYAAREALDPAKGAAACARFGLRVGRPEAAPEALLADACNRAMAGSVADAKEAAANRMLAGGF